MEKLLTGKMIHVAYEHINPFAQGWNSLSQDFHEKYDIVAKHLNQELGLCEGCGERPADGKLYEAAGDLLCGMCIHPPIEAKGQLMYAYTYDDGTLAGVMVPPVGISIEDYQKQLREEMEHISFVLSYESTDKPGACTAQTIKDLADLINKYVPIATPERSYTYSIQVFKDAEKIGHGTYKRHWDDLECNESSAAEGLSEAIYAYVFNHV